MQSSVHKLLRGMVWLTLGFCAGFFGRSICSAQAVSADDPNKLEHDGDFKHAAAALEKAMSKPGLTATERKRLEFEIDRLERIKQDFPFTKDLLYSELKKSVKGLTRAEYEEWIAQGRFDSRDIDGQRYFMGSSVANLFFRYPELNQRRTPPKVTAPLEQARWQSVMAIRTTAREQNQPYVLPKRFQVDMTVTAKAGAAPDGELIRAWLPIPRAYPFQHGFELLSSSSPVRHMDDEQSPIRALLLEQSAKKNKPTEFKIEYDYTAWGVSFDLNPARVQACDPGDPQLKPFLQETAHVVFTPEVRALSRQIAGEETNPCVKAKKFYDWIAEQIKYSYAIEYSTIPNISDYCRTRGYGDCGQEALLFITLCRLNGIPARWQSGWNTFPGDKTIHDWSEIYLAPYGWVPVDPYMGIFAMRYSTSLSPEQRRQLRDFYFGGLDQYRMAANSDHSQPLHPAKQSMRSDDVDFQRGELECGSTNIYFDKYSWKLERKEIRLPRAD